MLSLLPAAAGQDKKLKVLIQLSQSCSNNNRWLFCYAKITLAGKQERHQREDRSTITTLPHLSRQTFIPDGFHVLTTLLSPKASPSPQILDWLPTTSASFPDAPQVKSRNRFFLPSKLLQKIGFAVLLLNLDINYFHLP